MKQLVETHRPNDCATFVRAILGSYGQFYFPRRSMTNSLSITNRSDSSHSLQLSKKPRGARNPNCYGNVGLRSFTFSSFASLPAAGA